MTTWVLTLILLHYESVTINTVPGFATEAECTQYGTAWLAQANKRPEQTDVVLFRCKPRTQDR